MISANKTNNINVNMLYDRVSEAIRSAKNAVVTTVNIAMVDLNWRIGGYIVEEEQKGENRAQYGQKIIEGLANRLQKEFGKGFSISSLEYARKFYLAYQGETVLMQGIQQIPQAVPRELVKPIFTLSWTHYKMLIKITRPEVRKFYEIEAKKHCWSSRELERQIASLLFERITRSKNKDRVMQLSTEGQEICKPEDVIKDPLVLEFLGLPESPKLLESTIEASLINNLQSFLLELGNGFAFVARQKRLTIGHNHYYADLVF